jgi:hypothetical protein
MYFKLSAYITINTRSTAMENIIERDDLSAPSTFISKPIKLVANSAII